MLLWLALVVMTAVATLAVLLPLARGRRLDASAEGDAGHEIAVYRDQMAELERDRERGLIQPAEAEAARTEIARRLLKANAEAHAGPASRSWARPAAVAMLVFVPAVSLAVYTLLGSPELPDQPLAARLAAPPDPDDVRTMLARVEAHLSNNPGDIEGWRVLAPIYMRMGRYADSADAYGRILRLGEPTAGLQEAYGEALVASEGGLVSARAEEAFAKALDLDPDRIKARFYRAEGLMQSGRHEAALADYDDILRRSPADAPWLDSVRQKRAEALASLRLPADTPEPATLPPVQALAPPAAGAPSGPGADDVAAAAAMSAEERQAMIEGMVAQLASRLETAPDDAEGWQRLIRAYAVLGRADDAKAAYEKARSTFAGNAAALEAIDGVARQAGIGG